MKKFFYRLILLMVLIGGTIAFWAYFQIFSPVTINDKEEIIHIPSGSEKKDLSRLLIGADILKKTTSFERVSECGVYRMGTKCYSQNRCLISTSS